MTLTKDEIRQIIREELIRAERNGREELVSVLQETWYLLFDGSSQDGREQGNYVGRTTDEAVARQHCMKCATNPYSTGYVTIVTDTKCYRMWEIIIAHSGVSDAF